MLTVRDKRFAFEVKLPLAVATLRSESSSIQLDPNELDRRCGGEKLNTSRGRHKYEHGVACRAGSRSESVHCETTEFFSLCRGVSSKMNNKG